MKLIRALTHLPILRNRIPSLQALLAPGQLKYLPAWYRSRRRDYLLRHRIPWITFDAARFLRSTLKDRPGLRVFEYGCGGSTLFWGNFGATCISIEHDQEWIQKLEGWKAKLPDPAAITLRHISADPRSEAKTASTVPDLADPDAYFTDWEAVSGQTFRAYASAIDAFPDGHFDVVLVDGQARPSCLKHAAPKVRPGGYLILDNAEVPRYLSQAGRYLRDYELRAFMGLAPIDGALSQTNIYLRRDSEGS